MRANFNPGLKKVPSSVPHQSTGLRLGPVLTRAIVPLCKGGVGVRGFF
uniref:Uncharacterized protein n=1 Tax=Arundo donax TaxID=35708 RepID=A0A0A9AEY7_ARUDO